MKPEFTKDFGKYQIKIRVFCPGSGSSGAVTVLIFNNAAQARETNNFRSPEEAFKHAVYEGRELVLTNRRAIGV